MQLALLIMKSDRSIFTKFSSDKLIELSWCYLAVLIPSIFFKNSYLAKIFSDSSNVIINSLVSNPSVYSKYLYVPLFYGSDILEALVIVFLLYLVKNYLLRNKVRYFYSYAIMTLLLVVFFNWMSLKELSTLLTFETMAISLNWVWDNPEILQSYITRKRDILYIGIILIAAIVWSFLPYLLHFATRRFFLGEKFYRIILAAIILFVPTISIAGLLVSTYKYTETPVPFKGYWSSTFASIYGINSVDLTQINVPPKIELFKSYNDLAYPLKMGESPGHLVDLAVAGTGKKHVVIVSLETAARKYYPIINNPKFPTFNRMSKSAIISEKHHANTPFTNWANFSILTGVYPKPGGKLAKYGSFHTDGLPSVLKDYGYISTVIDSYLIDWHKGMKTFSKTYENLGFDYQLDTGGDVELLELKKSGAIRYTRALRAEQKSFEKAKTRILDAKNNGKSAFVFVDTIFGHFEWKAKPGDEKLPSKEKILGIIGEFDIMFSELISFLEKENILEETIIVVTGDHGLRYKQEYESLNEEMAFSSVEFNVPMMIYAPGLIKQQVRLPYITSHIDFVPTVLELLGINSEEYFYHGSNMLDRKIEQRITFMMNTALSPVDGFHLKGKFFSYNNLSGRVEVSDDFMSFELLTEQNKPDEKIQTPLSAQKVREALKGATEHFNVTAAYFLSREKSVKATP